MDAGAYCLQNQCEPNAIGLNIARKVICLNAFKRNHEVSDKRILEWKLKVMAIMPVVWKDIEAAEIGNMSPVSIIGRSPNLFGLRLAFRSCHGAAIAMRPLFPAAPR
jgi:hypothetical protein